MLDVLLLQEKEWLLVLTVLGETVYEAYVDVQRVYPNEDLQQPNS